MRPKSTIGVVFAVGAIVATIFATRPETRGLRQTTATGRGTGVLMGVIVDVLDDRPVANAEVTLGGATAAVSNTRLLTDADGRFVFMDLPKGVYTITATKAGYADGAYGRRRPSGLTQTLTLGDGERLGDLKIPIWKYGAIAGTIRDEAGEPMVETPVRVLTRTIVAGKRKLTPSVTTRTDDRGVYRLGSLTPGEYVVAVPSTQASAPESVVALYRRGRGADTGAMDRDLYTEFSNMGAITALELFIRPDIMKVDGLAFVSSSSSGIMRASTAPMPSTDGRIFVYPTQYHAAGTIIADATIVTVRSGEERAGVDVQLKLSPSARVSGIVTGPDGPLITAMFLAPDGDDLSTDNSFETATTMSDTTGRFTFLGVPPGQYQLHAFKGQIPPSGGGSRGGPPPTARAPAGQPAAAPLGGFTLSATQAIAVSSTDLDDLVITVRPGFRISGRAEFQGSRSPDPDFVRRMSATFDSADARPLASAILGRGQFQDDGQFSSYQLPPGRYYMRINNPPGGWKLTAAMWNGQDISNTPLRLDRDVSGVVITFTDRPSTLSGQVQTASGAPDTSATVLIFPADPGSWVDYGAFPRRLRAVRVGREGQYSETGLPAGDYHVVAIDEEASVNWQDPTTLQALARRATAITLANEESRTVMLQTVKR